MKEMNCYNVSLTMFHLVGLRECAEWYRSSWVIRLSSCPAQVQMVFEAPIPKRIRKLLLKQIFFFRERSLSIIRSVFSAIIISVKLFRPFSAEKPVSRLTSTLDMNVILSPMKIRHRMGPTEFL